MGVPVGQGGGGAGATKGCILRQAKPRNKRGYQRNTNLRCGCTKAARLKRANTPEGNGYGWIWVERGSGKEGS